MSNRKVVFNGNSLAFTNEVKAKVAEYFRDTGISQKANAEMVLKTVIMLTLMFGSYGLILSNQVGPASMLALAVIMGICFAAIGFVGHDALHGAYSSNPRINLLIGLSFDILGANRYLWKITHNGIHHTFTNVVDMDEDIRVIEPMVRLSPGSERFWYHRFQHIYAWFLYSLATINWIFVKDYRYMFAKQLGPYQNPRRPISEIVQMFCFKAFNLIWTLAIPLMVVDLPWQSIVFGYFVMNMVAGFILGVIFQMAHVVDVTDFVQADDNSRVADEWFVHQMKTTANFAVNNRFLTWYSSGLNYQIEHHLFPKICSVHYPAIRTIVESAARKHGVPYHCFPSFSAAIASHFRILKFLGSTEASDYIKLRTTVGAN